MAKTLRMKFTTMEGRSRTLSLNHPRGDVTASEVEDAMEAMMDEDFLAEGISAIAGADIVDRTVTTLF
ncbi:MAG: DUF2922 domain-containing protein [Synergistaceae bacterium]|nr:DUF2922 domain-containing protein [Synergistaceae bacterium]